MLKTSIDITQKDNTILPVMMQDTNEKQQPTTQQFLDFNLNFRAILMAYYLGTGG